MPRIASVAIVATSPVRAVPSWEPQAVAHIAATGDANPGNDGASATAGVLLG